MKHISLGVQELTRCSLPDCANVALTKCECHGDLCTVHFHKLKHPEDIKPAPKPVPYVSIDHQKLTRAETEIIPRLRPQSVSNSLKYPRPSEMRRPTESVQGKEIPISLITPRPLSLEEPEILGNSSLTFEEAYMIYDKKVFKARQRSKSIFVCGRNSSPDHIQKLLNFSTVLYNPRDDFHSSLLASFLKEFNVESIENIREFECLEHITKSKGFQKPLRDALKDPKVPLTLFLFIYINTFFKPKVDKIIACCSQDQYSCPLLMALIEVTSIFIEIVNKRQKHIKSFEDCLLIYAGLAFQWFDLYADEQAIWPWYKNISKKFANLSSNQVTGLLSFANHLYAFFNK